ncbi:MAG: carbohydrate ABC transporter permease [Caldilineaceae bacterium]|uniref:Carbohydrate ABC transporter permease n=1 Tax=Caldilineaceae bacterium SB0675_bin_29 TaxID=2605266 RepID=A0A6B1FT86_9CHLR|nr:carbohydrate ABC transporter permease [Caldilineaceae bacterium]MYH60273.1 carbohydrate ABC transporter permease [Caldilineaceae bacterium SB0675_bin_29]
MVTHSESLAGGPPQDQRRRLYRGDGWRTAALGILCVLMIAPLVMAVIISLKSPSQFTRVPFLPTWPLRWENYEFAVQIISQFLLNSIITSGATVIGVLLLSSLAAYSFAQIRFPGRTFVFYAVLALMMVPASLTLVPSFVLIRDLRLINTYWSLILPWIAGGQIIGILILRAFFESLPGEMFDACRIDGASDWQIYWYVALPLTRSMLGVVAVLNILGTWNNLIWPTLTLPERKMWPLTPGLYSYMEQYYTSYGRVMAGLLLGSIPLVILFVFTSRLFVEGLTSGAIKT